MTELAFPSFSTEVNHYLRMKAAGSVRDRHMAVAAQVRKGNIRQLFPSELDLNLSFEGTPIANFIDIVAHDMSEAIAPLPSLACTAGRMVTDADLRRAEVKNRIGDWYWAQSKLEVQMLKGADRYLTYGFQPFFIEPDVDRKCPFITLDDPTGAYYEKNRYGEVTFYAKRWLRSADDLSAMFPEYRGIIMSDPEDPRKQRKVPGDQQLEMVRWVDCEDVTLFLPTRNGLILTSYKHKMKGCPVRIAERPGLEDIPRGQFDDVIWTQVARAIFSMLSLEAAATAVQAPIAIPEDMDEFPIGPNALYQSSKSGDIHRVNLELPPGLFQENASLDQELKLGSRYPDARSGNSSASVITGKGVEALLGTFDSQIKGSQMVFKQTLQDVTADCFEMDEKWWANAEKTVSGTLSGRSYEIKYTPKKDINGQYHCTVTYGFAAGMHPSQSIITMLQLEGAGLIAHGTTQMNLPFDIDPDQEQRNIDVETTREALKQGLFSLVQTAGPMAAQGADPTLIIKMAADVVKARQDGKTMEDAAIEGFDQYQAALEAQKQQQQEQMQAAQDGAGGAPAPAGGQGGGDTGLGPSGLPDGVAPGQAGMPPGGLPTIQNMVAGFRGDGNLPIMQSTVSRRQATGGI